MTAYKIVFKYAPTSVSKTIIVERDLSRFINGFWVNSNGEFCSGIDALEYIFPHMISRLTQVSVPNDYVFKGG